MKTFREKINIENAKFLLACDNAKLSDLIKREPEDWNGENLFSNLEVYVKQLKSWLKTAINQMKNKGYIENEYKHSKNLVEIGRIYVNKFGIQKLTREVRGFLIKDQSKDFDMINAHPSILLNLMKSTYPELADNYKYLQKYISNRANKLAY